MIHGNLEFHRRTCLLKQPIIRDSKTYRHYPNICIEFVTLNVFRLCQFYDKLDTHLKQIKTRTKTLEIGSYSFIIVLFLFIKQRRRFVFFCHFL